MTVTRSVRAKGIWLRPPVNKGVFISKVCASIQTSGFRFFVYRGFYSASYCVRNAAKAVALQQLQQSLINSLDRPRSLVDETGKDLDGAGAGGNLLISVFSGKDSAHSNDHQFPLR